ncbi:L,D-transpeptidase family protein [Leptospira kanakyensis]|uniref:L,D-transpeptidase family protein n=1 Tax=Leptospira kanakyensis TaxID=2484968 RepID=UPI001ABFEF1E|nr:L,D-transpeptidase family protein [Leptospira kanakyensis]
MGTKLIFITLLSNLLLVANLYSESKPTIYVYKSEKILKVVKEDKIILEIPISLGFEPKGHKLEEGDGKTPEGTYIIDYQIPEWDYYKALHISYPTKDQVEAAKKINKNPGSGILIHGMKYYWNWFGHLHTYLNWTHGCIAVNNEEMDILFKIIPNGSKIVIEP